MRAMMTNYERLLSIKELDKLVELNYDNAIEDKELTQEVVTKMELL